MNHFVIKDKDEVKKLMILALDAGQKLLENGAEAYRVEDTMMRICDSRENVYNADSFAIQTGIFISLEYEDEVFINFRRVSNYSNNLDKISYVNQFSRDFVSKNISIEEGLAIIDDIDKVHMFSNTSKIIFGSLSGACFTVMFGGSMLDFVGAFITTVLTIIVLLYIDRFPITFFVSNFIGAFLSAVFAYISIRLGIGENLDKIIIGAIMYLVPGVSLTNAIRDTMSGDSLSGLSKGIEAILTAMAIAFGVGIIVNLYSKGVL